MKKGEKVLLALGALLVAAGVFVGVTIPPTAMPTTTSISLLPIRQPASAAS